MKAEVVSETGCPGAENASRLLSETQNRNVRAGVKRKKASISGAVYARLALWFPRAEDPLSFTKMELFKGSTPPHVSFTARGKLLQLVSKESNLKLSEHPKTMSTLISRSGGDE